MSIATMIQETAKICSERVALVDGSEVLTFAALSEKMDLWHRFLDDLEVEVGDRVALILGNTSNLVAIHGGNLLCGRISVPMNPRQTVDEFERLFVDARPTLVITCRESKDRVQEALGRAKLECHMLEEHLIRSSFSGARRSPIAQPVTITADMPAMIVYTSGTTGNPKGAVLSQGNLAAAARSLHQAWEFSPQDHLLLTLPLFHVHGLGIGIHGMLTSGFRVTLEKSFQAEEALERLQAPASKFTMFFGVPTYFHRFLKSNSNEASLAHLRLCVSGSAPLSPATHQEIEEQFGIRILERYGMSETLMNISNSLRGARHAGFVGQPLPGVHVRIVDDQGKIVADGQEGEIHLRGENVFTGYWQNSEATAMAFQDGWFKSGDLGRLDVERQSFQITGRVKELIISGGYNIHPQEIENVLHTYDEIEDLAVAGTPDEEFGELVTAFVVAKNSPITLDVLRNHCQDKLSAYKIPRRLVLVDKIPRNALGKVQRTLLGTRTS
ncbi:MAG: malonyl-CoA/methylmalonyl-CoA synthetase [Planctomycetota bacterium]|jgi:malonyl-CoA/methylmalonyl-CoA synthetase